MALSDIGSDESSCTARARTKIVATVGPACSSEDRLTELAQDGVDVYRLNMAHGDRRQHETSLERIRRVAVRLDRPLAVLVDLAGPKIRLGELPGGAIQCALGETFRFVRGDASSDPHELTTSYPSLVDELSPGDRILLADGTVGMLVEAKDKDALRCTVTEPGTLRSRQGVNLPGAKLTAAVLGQRDRDDALWAAEQGIDFLGLSFVRSAGDVRELKELLAEKDAEVGVIAKIEKPEALEDLEAIVREADGVMIARGDLGVEIDVARVPIVQKQIIAVAHRYQRPVITATQMLDSMQRSARPTRAEVSDVANAILDGSDACMLSGETAIGAHPREAVRMMNRVALETENFLASETSLPGPKESPSGLRAVTQAVVEAATGLSGRLEVRLIIVASHSGATALAMSKQRGLVRTVGVSDSERTLRRMCLYWGVVPLAGCPLGDWQQLVQFAESWGRADGCLASGDRLVVIAGTRLPGAGHNLLLVHEVA